MTRRPKAESLREQLARLAVGIRTAWGVEAARFYVHRYGKAKRLIEVPYENIPALIEAMSQLLREGKPAAADRADFEKAVSNNLLGFAPSPAPGSLEDMQENLDAALAAVNQILTMLHDDGYAVEIGTTLDQGPTVISATIRKPSD